MSERVDSAQSSSEMVAQREGILPRPLEPYGIQTVATVNDQDVALQVYWPVHGEEPMWRVAQGGSPGWMKRDALKRLRDEVDRVLAP